MYITCINVHTYSCIYTYMHIYIYSHLFEYVYMYMCVCICICVYIRVAACCSVLLQRVVYSAITRVNTCSSDKHVSSVSQCVAGRVSALQGGVM